MKHVVVTGGAGFIGVNLCLFLLQKGYHVTAIDNFISSSRNNIQILQHNNFSFFEHDIVHPFPSSMLSKLTPIHEIYHLACPTGVPNINRLGEEMILTSSIGTRNILELARTQSSGIVFTSSSEVYGDPQVRPQDESYTGNVDTIGARSPYEEGKRFSESLMKLYVNKYHIHGKIVRIFNTYGPYMNIHDSRVIPQFIQAIYHHKALPVQGKGLQKRTFCYVDDLIQGLYIVMKKGMDGEVYNLGSDTEITIKELAKRITLLSNQHVKTKYVDRPSHDHQQRLPSLKKIYSLGWKQKIILDEGLRRTLQWYGL